MYYWRQWREKRTLVREMMKLGIGERHADSREVIA
jgi:hypothetical protein